jgi:hypothetical protein
MNRETTRLLILHQNGQLSPAQEETLLRAALQDQDLFDALAAVELLRERLRPEVVLVPKRVPKGRVAVICGSIAASLVLAVALFRYYGPSAANRMTPAFNQPAGPQAAVDIDRVFQLELQKNGNLGVAFNHEDQERVYHIGDQLRIVIAVPRDGELYVFEKPPSGVAHQIFPNEFQGYHHVKSGDKILVSPGGKQTLIQRPFGRRLVRVILLPVGQTVHDVGSTVDGKDLEYVVDEPAKE